MSDIKLESKGVLQVLKSSEVADAVEDYARRIAASVTGQQPGADVVVDNYTTDRAASSVTIRDARGRLWQVRDGILTRAASSAGLEVKAR